MKKKKDTFSNTEIAQLIEKSKEKLALMVGNGFKHVESRFRDVEARFAVVETRIDGLDQRLKGTNLRIDDLTLNRVRYEDHRRQVERVDKLERKVSQKKVK